MHPLRAVPPRIESATDDKLRRAQEIVEAIGEINFKGNILPFAWLKHPSLHTESGKVNLPAAIILSDIIYWYRPIEEKDEPTGKILKERRRKFRADKLQKSYSAWAEEFGLTKRQVKEAVAFLRNRNLITIEFRHIKTESGLALSNVLFIEPVVAEIKAISKVKVEG